MKNTGIFLIAVLLGASLLGDESTAWRKEGKPAAETPNVKSKNGFGAQLSLTENAQFFEDRNKPRSDSPPSREPFSCHAAQRADNESLPRPSHCNTVA